MMHGLCVYFYTSTVACMSIAMCVMLHKILYVHDVACVFYVCDSVEGMACAGP